MWRLCRCRAYYRVAQKVNSSCSLCLSRILDHSADSGPNQSPETYKLVRHAVYSKQKKRKTPRLFTVHTSDIFHTPPIFLKQIINKIQQIDDVNRQSACETRQSALESTTYKDTLVQTLSSIYWHHR